MGVHHKTAAERIKQDRARIENLYNHMLIVSDPKTNTVYQNDFAWEVARYLIAEELVMYPYIEKKLEADGVKIVEQQRQLDVVIKRKLTQFQHTDPSSDKFPARLQSLMDDIESKLTREEEKYMPMLADHMTPEEAELLGKDYNRTQHFLPSKPHAFAQPTSHKPFRTAMGLASAPVDRVRAFFDLIPTRK